MSVLAWGAANPASADSRKGFLAGGGLGPGLASVVAADDTRETKLGVTTDITLGYGITDQFTVFAMSRIVWFQLADQLTFSEVAGAGASYFLSERAPSFYVTGGVGYAVFLQPGNDAFEGQFGIGALVGVGYELAPHWLLELDLAWSKPGEFQTNMAMLKANFLYY